MEDGERLTVTLRRCTTAAEPSTSARSSGLRSPVRTRPYRERGVHVLMIDARSDQWAPGKTIRSRVTAGPGECGEMGDVSTRGILGPDAAHTARDGDLKGFYFVF